MEELTKGHGKSRSKIIASPRGSYRGKRNTGKGSENIKGIKREGNRMRPKENKLKKKGERLLLFYLVNENSGGNKQKKKKKDRVSNCLPGVPCVFAKLHDCGVWIGGGFWAGLIVINHLLCTSFHHKPAYMN